MLEGRFFIALAPCTFEPRFGYAVYGSGWIFGVRAVLRSAALVDLKFRFVAHLLNGLFGLLMLARRCIGDVALSVAMCLVGLWL